ncbi:folylpolyglutamate synthase, mitochondrial isoform X2 [Anopheles aquasalis]|uniref:folylpolyglutamate synthase, mitochondrial isoform X2 n=1 Tax=Anopheles aquasalis TaxID=42839 RepID=UPI00215B6F4B|nr:folylpolyglutamate synthase, mitochondrial isoform X2 [Anopheles aquasalis]
MWLVLRGSTCAMVESILRFNGYRTGFFSSPHLVSVTERIRLNGQPIEKECFVNHFWKIYNQLFATQQDNNDMPTYFGFLTILALDVFLASKVDVAIIEVGIGGRYDCTNVIQKAPVVGITSLGLEHTKLLGDTLEKIAWQKAGIIKNGSDVFTVEQPAECNREIERECLRKKAILQIVPSSLEQFHWEEVPSMMMKHRNKSTELNVSLAVRIAIHWIRNTRPSLLPPMKHMIPAKIVQGIDNCFWPGRLQVVQYAAQRTLFLDGAHTVDSIKVCAEWFKHNSHSQFKKLLLFNSTGDRDGFKMLSVLSQSVDFDEAFFTPNVAFTASCSNIDAVNHNFPLEQQMQRCELNRVFWTEQLKQRNGSVHVSVQSVFQYLQSGLLTSNEPCDILVTGSIHLLGATFSALHLEKQLANNKI